MISFVKHIAVLAAALIVTTALGEKAGDNSTPKPEAKDAGAAGKKAKKNKGAKASDDPNAPKKTVDVPVIKGHDSIGLRIPYFGSDGKRQMNFTIGVASRLDDNHVNMTDLQVETFNDDGEHEMQIDLPTSVLNTDTSVITTNHPVTIRRSDFILTGESMIFNTKTKQGGLGGNVHMLIYNLVDDKSDPDKPGEPKGTAKPQKTGMEPDSFKTPQSKVANSTPAPRDNTEKFYTPGAK
ncbi:MAG: LPS export ABC transporter periplasmic protein LptC [Chthoniobacter sp.]